MNEEQLLISFGANLKCIRLKQGISQEQLASLAELDRTYISSVERGKRNISLLNILRIASSLNVAPQALLTFNKDAPQNDS